MDINNLFTPTGEPTGNFQQDEYIYEAEQGDVSGLSQVNPNTTAETFYSNQNPAVLKAKAEAYHTEAGFKPPSNGQVLADMLGGLLLGYGAARLLGADGKASLAIGLNASGINHDKDLQEAERYKIIESSIEQNGMIYNPQSLWTFMKTGNGSAMEQEEREYFNAGQSDINRDYQNQRLDKTQSFQHSEQQDRFAQQNAAREDQQAFQQGMQNDRFNNQRMLGQGQMTASRLSTTDNQIMDNDKPARDRYMQQYGGWTDAQSQLNIIKNAQSIINDPLSTDAQKKLALSEIQGAIPSLISGVARGEIGGNASLTEGQRKAVLPSLGLPANAYNSATQQYNGTISDEQINAIQNQIAGNRNSIAGYLNQMSRNEQEAMRKAQNGDLTGAFSYTGANLPQPVNPVSNSIQNVSYSDSELKASAGQPVASDIPEGAEITNGSVTLKAQNGVWVLV